MRNGSANGQRPPNHVRVAIVGTGFSGLGMAIRMRQEGMHDFVLFERASDLGGTWRDNTYPGIACDVPSNLYSFSFALNPEWSRSYSPGDEIWEYLRTCAVDHGVMPNIKFDHEIQAAHWEEDGQRWRLETSQGTYYADIVIGGMGPLAEPAVPNINGIDDFKGKTFHSAEWDHGFDFRGKRVAVIGTGASAIQFVPEIRKQAAAVHLFQRTAPWVMPRSDRKLTAFEHKLFRRFPLIQKLVRGGVYSMLEMRVVGFAFDPRIMRAIEAIARLHLKRQVKDPALRRKLTPDYRIGCKRILLSNDYYPALAQDNVNLITEGVQEVREHSIVTGDGQEHEIDAIVWGTGFHVTDNPAMARIYGRDGKSIAEKFTSPQAFLGAAITGFPNAFLMVGPNTGLGHSSMVYMIESHINYIMSALQHMERNDVVVDVRPEVLASYNDSLQDDMKQTVWTTGGCASWYLDAEGRNTTLWPGFTFQFRNKTRHFDPAAYQQEPRRSDVAAAPTSA